MYLGAHVSIADSIALAPARGRAVGADAIQIFSRSPRMLRKTKPLTPEETRAFQAAMAENRIARAVIHANYLINLGSPKKAALKYSREAFVEELERAHALGLADVIFHPGAHLGKGEAQGLRTIRESLDACLERATAPGVYAVLENTAGQGTTLGYSFDHLAEIIKGSSHPERLAVCIDTCHTFAAGYDFRTRDAYEDLIRSVDATVGIGRVRAFHLNDSKGDLGSRVDRHEDIGKGKLGKEAFRFLVNDERFRELPGCLEYPGTDGGYRRNLKQLRALIGRPESTAKARRARGT
jgi:deoxyribonuclease-4